MENYYSLIKFLGTGFILWCIAGIIICLGIVFIMAENYGRSTASWLIIAILYSPIIAIIGLAALGKTPEKKFEDWKVFERRKKWFLKELDEEDA
ncbi:hypothetical protein [Alistipes shahii]|uniref:hypothetical protein n=1 Tax=Alistipes shahii TaxID=328814 RepID=UPI00242AA0A5|nr:hypothetical protein [Alistipes shahii]MCI7592128.1 hypothetical protein [Alistipes shahii]